VATTDDYTATTGSLIIPANSLTGTISVPIKNDQLTETDEAFTLRLSNAQNATLATGTIIDNISAGCSLWCKKRKYDKRGLGNYLASLEAALNDLLKLLSRSPTIVTESIL